MIKISLLALTVLLGYSCTKKSSSVDLYKAKESVEFSKFINQKPLPEGPNLTVDKSIVNEKYPIEIALYNDGKFFYDLPNLGTGTGNWKYSDGKIELTAKRQIFDMHIEVYGADKGIEETAILFTDRFGANTLKMENHNL